MPCCVGGEAQSSDDDSAAVLATPESEAVAERIAGVPHELLQLNKRWVYRAMDAMGARTAIRAAADIGAIAPHVPAIRENLADLRGRIKDAASEGSATD
mgnify:CR=1 FL=1